MFNLGRIDNSGQGGGGQYTKPLHKKKYAWTNTLNFYLYLDQKCILTRKR